MDFKPATARAMAGGLAASLFFSAPALATVDTKNGNYTESYVDAQLSGSGYALRVQRVYNSRSNFSGMFGFGWCSEFETQLEKTPEGGIKIQECGAGQELVYRPSSTKGGESLDKSIDSIAAYYKKTNPGAGAGSVDTLKEQLREDPSLRIRWAKQAGITMADPKKGTVYVSDSLEVERVEFDGSNYTRHLVDGTSHRFNNAGRLIAMYDKNGNSLKFNYVGDLMKEVIDNNGRKLSFTHYPTKRVKEINGPAGLKIEYKYKGEDLAEAKNMWKNTYAFEYDENHNMTKTVFPDKTTKILTYNQKNDWVTSFSDRVLDNSPPCKETYDYQSDKQNPKDHYWTTATKTCGKEIKAEARFEFWLKVRADGKRYLHRVLNKTLADSLDVTYHPEFGRPTTIKKNALTTSFDYFPNGLVREKSTPTTRLTFEYKNSYNKVSKVTTDFYDMKGKIAKKRTTTFSYDTRANLITAENSDGQSVRMTHDQRGRIATIVDQAKKEVQLKYDEKTGRPSQITRPKLGSIALTYKANGEINTVESENGPTVGAQVASTFNNLLEIIAPATSELSL